MKEQLERHCEGRGSTKAREGISGQSSREENETNEVEPTDAPTTSNNNIPDHGRRLVKFSSRSSCGFFCRRDEGCASNEFEQQRGTVIKLK